MSDPALQLLIQRLDRLSDEFRELRDGLRKVVRLRDDDPEMALTRARKVLEYVARDTFQRCCQEDPGTRPLENMLQRLVKDEHLPKRLGAYADHIRQLGNVGTHAYGESLTTRDVQQSLEDLMAIIEWYFEKVRPEAAIESEEHRKADEEKKKVDEERRIAAEESARAEEARRRLVKERERHVAKAEDSADILHAKLDTESTSKEDPVLSAALTEEIPKPKLAFLRGVVIGVGGGLLTLVVVLALVATIRFYLQPDTTGNNYQATNSQSTPSNSPSPAVAATTVSTDDRIKIGLLEDLTGDSSSVGQMIDKGVKLATADINGNESAGFFGKRFAGGGINGRQIEIIDYDTASRGIEQVQPGATKLLQENKVNTLLIGSFDSGEIGALAVVQQTKAPLIQISYRPSKVTKVIDFVFNTSYPVDIEGEALAKFAFNGLKARSAALIANRIDSEFSKSFEDSFNRLGGKVVVRDIKSLSDKDFTSSLMAIRAANADVIFISGSFFDRGAIAKQATEAGIKVPLLYHRIRCDDLLKDGGKALDGWYFAQEFNVSDSSPAVQKFVTDFKARYNVAPDLYAALAYDAMKLLAEAIKQAGTTDGQKLRDAIAQTKNFAGATGPITINADHSTIKPIFIFQLQNGKCVYKETIQP